MAGFSKPRPPRPRLHADLRHRLNEGRRASSIRVTAVVTDDQPKPSKPRRRAGRPRTCQVPARDWLSPSSCGHARTAARSADLLHRPNDWPETELGRPSLDERLDSHEPAKSRRGTSQTEPLLVYR
ncbi:hypothetical protein NL676_007453 [Syzygium grande]|nr:hypothetical protein NL676_007453 [Syzygium grande]